MASAVAYRAALRAEPTRKSLWCGFLAAFFQIAPFLDIINVLRAGKLEDKKKQQMLRWDFVLKLAESVPQAFLQSYIMFASATHMQPLNLVSVTTSVTSVAMSLSLQLPKITPANSVEASDALAPGSDVADLPAVHVQTYGLREEVQISSGACRRAGDSPSDHHEQREYAQDGQEDQAADVSSPLHELMLCKATFFVYLASDLVLRCGAYAMLMSPFARHVGLATILGFSLCQSVAGYHSVWWKLLRPKLFRCLRGSDDVDSNGTKVSTNLVVFASGLFLSFMIGFAFGYSMVFIPGALGIWLFLLTLPTIILSAVPVVVTFERPRRDKAGFMGVRLLEYLCFGSLTALLRRILCQYGRD